MSLNDNWATPDWLYDKLDNEFNFCFDPCPPNSSFDGLKVPWGKCNYVNPPYVHKTKMAFVKKAIQEQVKGNTSVFLLPVTTGGELWHDLIEPFAKDIRFLRGRLKFQKFDGEGNNIGLGGECAPFNSMVVVF